MPESRCSGCGLRFTGVSAYDEHQRGTEEPPSFTACLDPRKVGMEVKIRERGGRRREVWGWPGDPDRQYGAERRADLDEGDDTGEVASGVFETHRRTETTKPRLCRACHYGHFNECEDEHCESMRLEARHE